MEQLDIDTVMILSALLWFLGFVTGFAAGEVVTIKHLAKKMKSRVEDLYPKRGKDE